RIALTPTQALRPLFCWQSSTASTGSPPARPTIRRSPITAGPASLSTDEPREGRRSMCLIQRPVEGRRGIGTAAARLLAIVGCTAMLAGCYTNNEVVSPGAYDYRLRHPIAIAEGPHTIELFIGSPRGGRTRGQRAAVASHATRVRRAPRRG